MTRLPLGASLSIAAIAAACTGSSDSEADKAAVKLWGRNRAAEEVQQRAKETIDPYTLDTNEKLRKRVLEMDFEEVVQRLGFVEYKGVAKFELSAGGRNLDVVEDTTIQHGLHGSFRVLQLDKDGDIARETIFDNGVFYVRNGPGEMRVQGIIKDQHLVIRDEAWQPLRVYTGYYGPRLGLVKVGAATSDGRSAARYKLGLAPGPELVTVPGMEGAKKPVSLSGELFVDEATGVPIKGKIEGTLEIPNNKSDALGRLHLSLDFSVHTIEAVEIKPKKFIPTIARHPTDIAPLAFLDGGTHTSTIIGGKKPQAKPPDEVTGSAPSTTKDQPTTRTSTASQSTEPEKKKKKKKK